MAKLEMDMKGWRWDKDLQLIQADVRLIVDGETLIDEPVCVDVGMPAMVRSVKENSVPDRWSPPEAWEAKPFFVCGCGDPECRGYSFQVEHAPATGDIVLTELEERPDGGGSRVLGVYSVPEETYRIAVMKCAEQFLEFVDGLDYRPLFAATVPEVRRMLESLEQGSCGRGMV